MTGLLYRLGRLCVRRRWIVLLAWVAACGAGLLAKDKSIGYIALNLRPSPIEPLDRGRGADRRARRSGAPRRPGGGLAES